MGLTTIFFDFGGTLAHTPKTFNRPWKVWVQVAREFNLHLSPTLVQHALEAVDEKLSGQIYQYVGRVGKYWQLYDEQVMDRLRIREHREDLANALEKTFGDPATFQLFPETRAVLESLRTRGYHLGLISNGNDGLLNTLEYHGLDKLLETVTYSQEVGIEKPAAKMFSTALQRAHSSPSDALHVGDSIPADVEGALSSGLHAVWLNREHHHASVDCPMIHTLDELLHMVELIDHAAGPLR
jgi:HAD superfamily hydrolase (TIGR01549 family)